MNRLWVRISLVIAIVVIFITLFPVAVRQMTPRPKPPLAEQRAELSPEEIAEIQERAGNRAWRTAWITVAVGGVIALGAGIWLSRSLAAPLDELDRGAREVAAQNLAYRVPEAGSQEIRNVAHSFNEMAIELERSQTVQRNMLADITHELRHPVHVLRGNLQGIIDGVFPLEMEEIVFLSEQTYHLSQLVNDLHELALAEAHELPLHKEKTALNGLVLAAVDAVMPLATNKNIGLQMQFPDDDATAVVDGARIRQAIQNLLSNAIRYTPEFGKITVNLTAQDNIVMIRVTDNGIGISEHDLPHVFDRFYRSDSSRNRDSQGAGLGLAITKAIVEGHNGRITVASPGQGQGTAFTIYLPIST